MKNPYELLRVCEHEILQLRGETEVLRFLIKLLDYNEEGDTFPFSPPEGMALLDFLQGMRNPSH